MPVSYGELTGYPTERETPNSFTATRKLVCAWADRFALGLEIENVLYPYRPETLAYPINISSAPMDGECLGDSSGKLAVYEKAVVTVEYSTPEVPSGGGGLYEHNGILISERIEPITEFLTIDPSKFQWESGATGKAIKETEAPGKAIRGFDWTVQKFNVPGPLSSALALILPDTVNDAQLVSPSLGLTFPVETLYFHAPIIERKGGNADEFFDLLLRFSYRKQTWNKFFRAETGLYEYIYLKGTTTIYKPFDLGDFASAV
jgi:hypothetical protein